MATEALSPRGNHVVALGAVANEDRVREATDRDLATITEVAKAGDDGNWRVSQIATGRLAAHKARAAGETEAKDEHSARTLDAGRVEVSDPSGVARHDGPRARDGDDAEPVPAPRVPDDARTAADRVNDARNATIDAAKDELEAQITGRAAAEGIDAVTGIRALGVRFTAAMVRHSDATRMLDSVNQELVQRQTFDTAQAGFDVQIAAQEAIINASDETVKADAQTELDRLNEAKTAAQTNGEGQALHRGLDVIQNGIQLCTARTARHAQSVQQARAALEAGIATANEGIVALQDTAVLTNVHPNLVAQENTGATFVHGVSELMMTQSQNADGLFTMVPVSSHQKGPPPTAIAIIAVAGAVTSSGFADAMKHAPDAFGGRIAEQLSSDLKTGAAASNFAGSVINLVKSGSEIRKAAIAQRKINALVASGAGEDNLKLRGLRIMHGIKVSAAASKVLSAAEKGIKFVQYLADKALVHIKEFFLTVLKYLVPTFKFLQGAVDLISGSMAAHRQRVDGSEFATVEREVSNGFKIALAIVNIAMAIFTVVVAALAIALSPILMPALYGGIGVANLVKVGVDLASAYANSGMQAEVFNTWKRITPAIEFATNEITRLQANIDSSLEAVPAA